MSFVDIVWAILSDALIIVHDSLVFGRPGFLSSISGIGRGVTEHGIGWGG